MPKDVRKVIERFSDKVKRQLPDSLQYSRITMERPIFISGLMRTGSYLLYDLLALSPDFASPYRRERRHKGLYGHENWGKENYQVAESIRLIPVEGAYLWFNSGVYRSREDIDNNPYEAKDLDRIGEQVKEKYYKIRTGFTRGDGRKLRILDKAPAFLSFISVIDHVFPDAKYIFTIRDPRAIANSYLRRVRPPKFAVDEKNLKKYGTWGVPPRGWEEVKDRPLVYRISWQISQEFQVLEEAFKKFGQDRVRIVSYEGLVRDPLGITKKLLSFIQAQKYIDWDLIPESFQNFNPPWFDSSGNLSGEFGKDRMFKEEEREQFEPLDYWIDRLGYDKDNIGAVTEDFESRLQ